MEIKELFFALLRHAVCAEQLNAGTIDACTSENLESVYTLAKQHGLVHLVGHALEGLAIPECEATGKLKKAKLMAIYRYARMDYEFERICHVLNDGKIPFIPLKGSVLRSFYPESWMRNSCDIDVLVKPDDLWNAVMLLEKEGYTRKGKSHHDVSLYAPNNVHLELHYALMDDMDSMPEQKCLDSVWTAAERKAGTKSQYLMTDEMFYLYHIVHMAVHFLRGGCGVRSVLDIWILNNRVPGDLAERHALLKQSGLLTFAIAAEKLSACWFSGISPDREILRFGNCVLNGGIYGNRTNGATMRKASDFEVRIPFRRILIPYEDIRYAYPVLDKRPWLMPVCQILRWFRLLGILRQQLKKFMAAQRVSHKTEMEMRQLLQYLELTGE